MLPITDLSGAYRATPASSVQHTDSPKPRSTPVEQLRHGHATRDRERTGPPWIGAAVADEVGLVLDDGGTGRPLWLGDNLAGLLVDEAAPEELALLAATGIRLPVRVRQRARRPS